jgi:hypothetical protein
MSHKPVTRIYNHHTLPEASYSPAPQAHTLAPKTIFVEDYRNREITVAERMALMSALALKGETLDQFNEIAVGGDCRWHMVWPRNLTWKSLPHIAGTKIAHMFSDQTIVVEMYGSDEHQFDLAAARRQDDELVMSTRRIVVWEKWKDSPKLRGLLSIWDERDQPIIVSFFDGFKLEDAPEGYAKRLKDIHEAEERFLWNYQLNFVMLCSRAIAKVASEFGDTKESYARTAPRLDAIRVHLAHPLALYTLYRLRDGYDHSPIELRPYDAKESELVHSVSVDAAPLSSFDFTAGRYSIRVDGTGAYSPFVANDLQFDGFHHTELKVPVMFEKYRSVLSWLSISGYAVLDTSHRLRLTPKGFRLLELLGPALDDPDVLLRWRDANTGGWKRDAIPAIDRWLNRAFRAVKRQVAGLAPAPVIERDVSHWESPPEGRPVVHGFLKRIDKARLGEGGFRERVEAVEAASLAQPFANRRFGILRDTVTMDNEDVPIAFWVGVPMGIFSLYNFAENTVGPVKANEEICKESAEIQSVCDGMIDGPWETSEPRLWGIGRTSDGYVSYFERDTSLDSKEPVGSDGWRRFKDMRPVTLAVVHNGFKYR